MGSCFSCAASCARRRRRTFKDSDEDQEDRHRRGGGPHRSACGVGPDCCSVDLRSRSDQRRNRLLGPAALVPALCPTALRPRQTDAARHQHARRGGMAGPANEPEPLEPAGRDPRVHCRLPIGKRCAQDLARGTERRSHAGCPIHLGVDRHIGGGLQHRPDEDLCQRGLQWRRDGVCALLHAVRSHRGGRDGGGGAITAVELVYGPATGPDDCVSWDR